MFVYDAGELDGSDGLVLCARELEEARFVEVGQLDDFLPVRQARRLAVADRARSAGVVVEMVNGQVVDAH